MPIILFQYGTELHSFQFKFGPNAKKDVEEQMNVRWGLSFEQVAIQYVDADGDLLSVEKQEDFNIAQETMDGSQGDMEFRVLLNEGEKPTFSVIDESLREDMQVSKSQPVQEEVKEEIIEAVNEEPNMVKVEEEAQPARENVQEKPVYSLQEKQKPKVYQENQPQIKEKEDFKDNISKKSQQNEINIKQSIKSFLHGLKKNSMDTNNDESKNNISFQQEKRQQKQAKAKAKAEEEQKKRQERESQIEKKRQQKEQLRLKAEQERRQILQERARKLEENKRIQEQKKIMMELIKEEKQRQKARNNSSSSEKVKQKYLTEKEGRELVREQVLKMLPQLKRMLQDQVMESDRSRNMSDQSIRVDKKVQKIIQNGCQICKQELNVPFYFIPDSKTYICNICQQKTSQTTPLLKIRDQNHFKDSCYTYAGVINTTDIKESPENWQKFIQEARIKVITKIKQQFNNKVKERRRQQKNKMAKK